MLQVYFKEASVKQVDVPTLTGAFGILPAHVPTLQVLRPGVVTVFNDDGSSAKYFGKIFLWKNEWMTADRPTKKDQDPTYPIKEREIVVIVINLFWF